MATRMLLLFAYAAVAAAVTQKSTARMSANPIRKVVTMLQTMQKKVTEEGEKADGLFEKYLCYCKTSGSSLTESVEAAEAKAPELASSIEAGEGKLKQLDKDLKAHNSDRDAGKKAMAEATALREKEKAAFDKSLAESKTNHAALMKAVAAISDGMSGSFLQTQDAAVLRSVLGEKQEMMDADREEVLAFLSGKEGDEYAPASGQILGILKQMGDEMYKDQQDSIATEEAAVKDHESLLASKKKEVSALSKSIEEKLGRKAETGVEIAAMKNDLGDTAEALSEDKSFLADLEKNCASASKVHEEEKKMRAQELVALADTIKVLNDDDALDLFTKTLPSTSASFMQVQVTSKEMRAQAQALLSAARARVKPGQGRHRLDFIALALQGRKAGFEKVIELVDQLVATLKEEQVNDDDKKEYCAKEFDEADDQKKGLERSISDHETVIEETKEGIATLTEEIKALEAGIKALDKSVAEATAQRKAENAEYKELMASDGTAKELILFAKNRLAKFYNPKLYKSPPKRELSEEDRIFENQGGDVPEAAAGGIAGTGIGAFVQLASKTRNSEAPPPPPETAAAYTKKSEESGGVIAMMDLLISDLDKEMTIAETEEKNAQEDYEKMMADSAEKRTEDSKVLTDKEAAKADLEASLEESTAEKKSASQELMTLKKYIMSLHSECDWLVQYYDVRKEARADEIDSLEKAKAVLSGADFSLLQRSRSARARKFLRHA